MKLLAFITILLALLLSGCSALAAPTIDPAQVQASSVAAANTMVALTQAAGPTATEVPLSQLESASPTLEPNLGILPTLDPSLPTAAVPVTPSGTTGSDPCASNASYKTMDPGAPGPTIRNLNLSNLTTGTVILSAYLNKTKFGQCGGNSFKLSPHQDLTTATMKIGCYDFAAIITGKTETKLFAHYCIMDDIHKWTVAISTKGIKLVGP